MPNKSANPLLYEINTRCWLSELSEQNGKRVTLADVPDTEFAQWQKLGFTHIWLMGVWVTGRRAGAYALADAELQRTCREVLPDFKPEDIGASPYAIAGYKVPPALGGEAGLKHFRQKLHAHGLKLLLDFVPNHVGLDHPWLIERPELFVQSAAEMPGTFLQGTGKGPRRLAHGKDPNFPPWGDTVQLDYRRAATRTAMMDALLSIAKRCDGVRCDMAMLVLNDVFAKTWAQFPPAEEPPASEFWADAIVAAKRSHPDFLFLAEAYWSLEGRLQSLGFDFTYDKELYDALIHRDPAGVQKHLLGAAPEFVKAGAHFLENHDERRIASVLSSAEHCVGALLVSSLPGMCLLHDGQLTGSRLGIPVQLLRRPVEPHDEEIKAGYEQLLAILQHTAVGRGSGDLLKPREAWPGNGTAQDFVIVQWQKQPPDFDLAVVNLAPHRSQCFASLTVERPGNYNWSMKDLLGTEEYERSGDDLQAQGLYLDLPEYGAQLFHFSPRI
jgi:Alpha amylase, catalytic domain